MVADMADDAVRQASYKGINIEERLGGALEIAEKLTSPAMVSQLNSVLELANKAPGLVSMVADMADDAVRQASNKGINIEERLGAALEIAEKLTSPAMVSQLNSVLELANQGPGLVSMVADMADDAVRQASNKGIDIEERLGAALEIAEKLTSPAMVSQLNSVLELANQGPGLVAMTIDMLDEGYQTAAANGFDLDLLLKEGANLTSKMTVLMRSEEFKALLDSGALAPKTLKIVNCAAQALAESQNQPPQKVGFFGMLRVMGNPDMQRTLGFLTAFAKQFGKKL
ncbi:MAG: DUF1641 domain-containing protein [Chitinophagales bacterium]